PAEPSVPPPPASPRSVRRRFGPAGSGSAVSVPPGVWVSGGGGSPGAVSRIGGTPTPLCAGAGARRPDGPTARGAKPAEGTITPGCAGGTAVAGGAAAGAETGGAGGTAGAMIVGAVASGGIAVEACAATGGAGGGGTVGAVIVGAVASGGGVSE